MTSTAHNESTTEFQASKLAWALSHAQRGLRVFPIAAGKKTPTFKGWQSWATTDATTIRAHWQGEASADNIGIVADNLLIIDVDDKLGRNGSASLAALAAQRGGLPPTLTTLTPTGGRHLYYRTSRPVGNRVGLAQGVDIRGHGGYVLAPGSTIGGKPYTWQDASATIAEAPAWLVDLVGAPVEDRAKDTEGVELPPEGSWSTLPEDLRDRFDAVLSEDAYLSRIWDGDKPDGDTSYSGHLMSLARGLKQRGFTLPEFALLVRAWSLKSSHGDKDLARQIARAWKRCDAEARPRAEDEFSPVNDDDPMVEDAPGTADEDTASTPKQTVGPLQYGFPGQITLPKAAPYLIQGMLLAGSMIVLGMSRPLLKM